MEFLTKIYVFLLLSLFLSPVKKCRAESSFLNDKVFSLKRGTVKGAQLSEAIENYIKNGGNADVVISGLITADYEKNFKFTTDQWENILKRGGITDPEKLQEFTEYLAGKSPASTSSISSDGKSKMQFFTFENTPSNSALETDRLKQFAALGISENAQSATVASPKTLEGLGAAVDAAAAKVASITDIGSAEYINAAKEYQNVLQQYKNASAGEVGASAPLEASTPLSIEIPGE